MKGTPYYAQMEYNNKKDPAAQENNK